VLLKYPDIRNLVVFHYDVAVIGRIAWRESRPQRSCVGGTVNRRSGIFVEDLKIDVYPLEVLRQSYRPVSVGNRAPHCTYTVKIVPGDQSRSGKSRGLCYRIMRPQGNVGLAGRFAEGAAVFSLFFPS
jgi:hypothetical protein